MNILRVALSLFVGSDKSFKDVLKHLIFLSALSESTILNRFSVAVFFAIYLISAGARAAGFTASLDHDTITLGESATLSLTFEGGQPKDLPMPAVPGLQVVNTGNAQNFSILNGQMNSTVTVTYSTGRFNRTYTLVSLISAFD